MNVKFEFEIGGKKRTLNFGMACWEMYCEKMGISPDEMISVLQTSRSFRAMRTLVFSALKSQEILEDTEEVTEKQVANWVNDDFGVLSQVLAKAMETLSDGQKVQSEVMEKKSRSHSEKSKK